jgi:rhomboid family protein
MFIPYSVDVPMERTPWGNWFLVVLIIAVSIVQWEMAPGAEGGRVTVDDIQPEYLFVVDPNMTDEAKAERLMREELVDGREEAEGLVLVLNLMVSPGAAESSGARSLFDSMVLGGWGIMGLFGHVFLHADAWHLFGNMVFLMVFGNAVCAKLGHARYLGLFFVLAFSAAAAHNMFSGGQAIGASGAVNGVVGMYLVLYPFNDVRCFYWFWVRIGSFAISGIFVILFWLAFDIWGAIDGGGGIAYWAHLGGIIGGVVVASLFYHMRWIEMNRDEESLWETFRIEPLVGSSGNSSYAGQSSPGTGYQQSPGYQREPIQRKPIQRATIQPPPPPPLASVPLAESPPEFISFACDCGKRYRVAGEHGGKKTKCKACDTLMEIPVG